LARIAGERGECLTEALEQEIAVRQAGQCIVQVFVLELAFDALAHHDLLAQVAVDGGKFAGATVTGATIVSGLFAQNPTGVLGAWRIGPSDDCLSISGTATYKVTMMGVSCQGF